MADGTIYAGISPDSGSAMYVTRADASRTLTFNSAARYAAQLNAHGHRDWRLPTKAELQEMYKNRNAGALKGTFNERDSNYTLADWYWTGRVNGEEASMGWFVDFRDGHLSYMSMDDSLAVRPLRAEPQL